MLNYSRILRNLLRKKRLLIIIIIALLISNIYFLSQYSAFKSLVKGYHQGSIERSISVIGQIIPEDLQRIENGIRTGDSVEEQLIRIGYLTTYLGEVESSINTIPAYAQLTIPKDRADTMSEISGLFRGTMDYLRVRLTNYLLEDDYYYTNEEVLYDLETLREGYVYLYDNLDQDLLNEGNYKRVGHHWAELMLDIISKYPDNEIFQIYKRDWGNNLNSRINK